MRPNQEFHHLLHRQGVTSSNYVVDGQFYPYYPISGIIQSTSLSSSNTFWKTRIKTTATSSVDTTDNTIVSATYGVGVSIINTDNSVTCKFGLTGGDGNYSIEFSSQDWTPYYTTFQNSGYNGCGLIINNDTYIYLDFWFNIFGGNPTGLWLYATARYNGSYLNSNIQALGGTQATAKITWNKVYGSYSVDVTNGTLETQNYNVNVLSGSGMTMSNLPMGGYGTVPSSTASVVYKGLKPMVISNYQANGLTGSNRGINNPPPLSWLVGDNDRW